MRSRACSLLCGVTNQGSKRSCLHTGKKWPLSPALGVLCPWSFLSAQGFFPALKAQAFFLFYYSISASLPSFGKEGCAEQCWISSSLAFFDFPYCPKTLSSQSIAHSALQPCREHQLSLVFRYSVLYAVFAFHFYIWLTAIFFTLWKSYPVCLSLSGDTCCLSSSLSSCFLSIHLFLEFSPWLSCYVGLQQPNPARFTC